jgi:PAS domain S-box-containing protein
MDIESTVKILVVDDQLNNLVALGAILDRPGLAVVAARSGDEALKHLLADEFAAIILDVQMPGLDGFETASLIRNRAKSRRTPIIFLTASHRTEVNVLRGYTLGAVDYMFKPVDAEILRSKVAVFAELFRKTAALERQNVELTERRREAEAAVRAREAANLELERSTAALAAIEERLTCTFETVADGIIIVEAQGRCTFANAASERILGLSRSEIIRRTRDDPAWHSITMDGQVLAAEDLPSAVALRTGEPLHDYQFYVQRGDGAHIAVSMNAVPLRDRSGSITGAVVSFRDVSEQRRAQEAVALAKAEAERANRAKSEFLSRMSHDLRTPLNAILGFAQILQLDELSTEQQENIDHILKGGTHLLDLINEVLDIARIDAGHLALASEPVDVADLMRGALELVKPAADRRRITLTTTIDSAIYVRADRQRLNQTVLNLLSNAVKYNREGGSVTVSGKERAGGRFKLGVTDTGAGIAPDKLPLLFQPFERLGAERSDIEGTGLGLALSKGLVEAMGGSLGVNSQVGQGSTFWIELDRIADPVMSAAAAVVRVLPPSSNGSVTGTVLCIEDNLSNVRLVERILSRRSGVRLLVATTGLAGLQTALENRPDLILLDLHLGDISGEDVLRRLKQDPRTRRVPVAMVTADATPSVGDRLLTIGADFYITKPLIVTQLLHVIDDALQSATPMRVAKSVQT